MVGSRVGTYRILEPVGRGGMGEVWKAWDERLDRPVAVKALPDDLATDPKARHRFVRETRYASRVVHPYVATVFDVVEEEDSLFLVMEHIEGRRIDDAIEQDHPDRSTLTQWALEISEALQAIHGQGLVHRDLKPGNVMITPDGHVKILDFGVARVASPRPLLDGQAVPTAGATVTEEGAGVGTVLYMSPEQVRGRKVDSRSDLFSFGTLLYEAITGIHPFARESILASATAIASEHPGGDTEPRTLSESGPLRGIVLKLLEKNPETRYQTASDVAADLRAVLKGETLPSIRAVPGWRRRPVAALAVAAATIVAVALVLWAGRVPPGPDLPRIDDGGLPGLVVLPFGWSGGDEDAGAARGSFVASLVRADLAESGAARIVGSARTDSLAGVESEPTTASVLLATGSRFLVTGLVEEDGGRLVGAVEVFDRNQPDSVRGFRVAGASATALAGEVSRALQEQVFGVPDAVAVAVNQASSMAEDALLAAESGRRAASAGRLREAEEDLERAVDREPGYVRAHLELARTLYAAGWVDRAREAARRAAEELEAGGGDAVFGTRLALEVAAVTARADEDREAEVAAARMLVEAYPEDGEAWSDLAEALDLAGRSEESIEVADRARKLAPEDPAIAISRARILGNAGRFEEARADLAGGREMAEAAGSVLLLARASQVEGDIFFHDRRYEAARSCYVDAVERWSDLGQPLRLAEAARSAANADLVTGMLARAEGPLRHAVGSFHDAGNARGEAYALNSLGAVLYRKGALDEAETVLRRSVRLLDETHGEGAPPSARITLASLLNHLGRGGEAREFARAARSAAELRGEKGRQATAEVLLADIDAQRGDLSKAADRYLGVAESTDEDVGVTTRGWAWMGLAETWTVRGRLAKALEASDHAVDLARDSGRPGDLAWALFWRARARREAGDRSGFLQDLDEARVLGSSEGGAVFEAKLSLEKGLDAIEWNAESEATTHLRAALATGTESVGLASRASGALAVLLCESGRATEGLDEAKGAVLVARTVGDRVTALNDRARCLAAAGRHEAAGIDAKEALRAASAAGMDWQTARAAAIALELPAESLDDETRAEARRAGRQALNRFLAEAPGGRSGPVTRRPEVREVMSAIGIEIGSMTAEADVSHAMLSGRRREQ